MSAETYRTLWGEYQGAPGQDYLLLLDALDIAFHRTHGMLAPGKSYALAFNGSHPNDETRRARYRAWRGMLGPVDIACIVSMQILRDRLERES